MAGIGLPKSGRIGFELFDKVNLGATEFTEHINYRRALEGELERTVMSLAEVEQARVHLTFPKDSVFLEAQQPAKASVLVRIRPGARLAPQNVLAITHLVGSAVEGLSPDAVSVLDMNGNLLNRPKPPGALDGSEPSAATLDYRHQVETDLLAKINSTLSPLLGRGEVPRRRLRGVRFHRWRAERRDLRPGAQRDGQFAAHRGFGRRGRPPAASREPLPPCPAPLRARPAAPTGPSAPPRTSPINPAAPSRRPACRPAWCARCRWPCWWTRRSAGRRTRTPIKRVLVPPSPEKLKVIHDLVAGITGFSQERGDQLVIETLPFETTLQLEPPASAAPPAPLAQARHPDCRPADCPEPEDPADRRRRPGSTDRSWVVASRVLRRKRTQAGGVGRNDRRSPPCAAGASAPVMRLARLARPVQESQLESQLAERDALQAKMDAQALSSLKLAPVITKKAEVLAKHLREKIAKEPEVSVQILRTWIREEES